MEDKILTIIENRCVGPDVYLLTLNGDVSLKGSGQFANLKLDNHYLRRPLSIHDYDEHSVSFLYKVLGQGTKELSEYPIGKTIDVLLPLGNGFDTSESKKPLLIGGGIGIAPLYHLAKELVNQGKEVKIILGFKTKNEVFYEEEFKRFGSLTILTDDGSYGVKGNPVSYLKSHVVDYDHYYACGPSVMLKFLAQAFENGEVSLEARMGCGFGACMGCSIKTKKGNKRICKDGPVFPSEEVFHESTAD